MDLVMFHKDLISSFLFLFKLIATLLFCNDHFQA